MIPKTLDTLYMHIKHNSENLLLGTKHIESSALSGDLKPIWGELKKKTKGNACYFSLLYTADANTNAALTALLPT